MMYAEQNSPCARVLDAIETYLDDDLDDAARGRLETHVAACPACARELSLARSVKEILGEMATDECGTALTHRLLEVAQSEPTHNARRGYTRKLLRFALPAAAALVILLGALVELSPGPPPQAEVSQEEILRAEIQLRGAFAYLAQLGQQTARTVGREVIQDGIAPPLLRQKQRFLPSISPPEQPQPKREPRP